MACGVEGEGATPSTLDQGCQNHNNGPDWNNAWSAMKVIQYFLKAVFAGVISCTVHGCWKRRCASCRPTLSAISIDLITIWKPHNIIINTSMGTQHKTSDLCKSRPESMSHWNWLFLTTHTLSLSQISDPQPLKVCHKSQTPCTQILLPRLCSLLR